MGRIPNRPAASCEFRGPRTGGVAAENRFPAINSASPVHLPKMAILKRAFQTECFKEVRVRREHSQKKYSFFFLDRRMAVQYLGQSRNSKVR